MAKKPASIDEILAACRQADGAGGSSPPASKAGETGQPPAADSPSAELGDALAAPREGTAERVDSGVDKPARPSGGGAPKKPQEMSVAEILAAARSGKSGGPPKPTTAGPPRESVAERKPAAAAVASPKAPLPKQAVSASKDTSSILAAARKQVKPGPMSKAEAAARRVAAPAPPREVATVPPKPERPAYAIPKVPATGTTEDRRGFLTVFFGSFLAVGFTCLGAVTGLWGLGLARFMFPNILTEPPNKFKVGFPSDFAPDTVADQFKAQYGVWIVNTEYEGERQITALRSVCTHLGCTPNWLEAEQKFKCPCHGSGFYKDGINFEGPAPRPLERYAIRIADDGQLEVDKSKKFQQELGQWSNSACYVAV
jgi:cytochrome b6-f complex iron-sulfur subunit